MHSIVEQVRQRMVGQQLPSPLLAADIEEAERLLGFSLPPLLRELYSEIADGGFGPGYGFLPLLTPGPEESEVASVVRLYTFFRMGGFADPSFSWPERLLPVLDWGCAISSCVDCSSASLAVFRDDSSNSLRAESSSLERWLSDWIAGRDLWQVQHQ